MKWILFVLAIMSFGLAILFWAEADEPMRELEALSVALMGALFMVGSAIVEAANGVRAEVRALKEQHHEHHVATIRKYNEEMDRHLGRL